MSKFLDETGLARIRDWIKNNFAPNTNMTGADSSNPGAAGLVPAPAAGDQEKYLMGDATWDTPAARHGTGPDSVVEGYSTNAAAGGYAHAEGLNTRASASCSHAEGSGARANGTASHAEGFNATASGVYSHAEGVATVASGQSSHTEGQETAANHKSQHVFGEYNIEDTSTAAATERGNYVEIVGNGTGSSARANARTLDWSGNEVLAGSITATSFIGSGAGLTNLPNATTRYSATLTTGGWTEDTTNNWYSQTISISGFTYSASITNLSADLDMSSATAATASVLQEAWALVGRIYADANGVTAICYGNTPATNIPFILCVTG